MADRTLTINHADGGSETYTINRDKFAGVREMQVDGAAVTVDHTAVPKHQSKETTLGGSQSITIKRDIEPLLSKVVGGAAAAYSLRDLNDTTGVNKVVRVRRESDNGERDFNAKEVSNGTLQNWTNAQVTPPLDVRELTATGRDGDLIEAAAAYSLRNLSDSYAGDVVEVRRSSDNALRSFTAAEVTDGTMVAWVGAGNNGTVSKWYDQSTTSGVPNAKHAVQTSAAKQPKIVDGGTLVTGGNKFDGTNDFLTFPNTFLNGSFALSTVFNLQDRDKANNTLFGYSNSGNFIRYQDSYGFGIKINGAESFINKTLANNTDYVMSITRDASNLVSLYVDGSFIDSFTQSGLFSLDRIGVFEESSNYFLKGTVTETLIYNSDQSDNRTALESNIGEVYGIAGIPAYDNTVNGFVETWYDQSGNGNNATQLTAGSQPKIVDAGSLVTGGLDFDGVDDTLTLSGSGLDLFRDVGYGQIFIVITPDNVSTGSNRYFEAVSGSSGARVLLGDSQDYAASSRIGGRRLDADGFQDIESSTSHSNNETLITGFLNWADADAYLYLNGTEEASSTGFQTAGNTSDTRSQDILISGVQKGDFKTKEIIIYNTDQTANRLAIEANINNQYDIY